jgi:hypothetical protein
VTCTRTLFGNWRSLNQQVQLHESVRNEDEMDAIILPPHQVAMWEKSEGKRNAIKLLGEFSSYNPPPLSRVSYCAMRDYFFVEIATDQAFVAI